MKNFKKILAGAAIFLLLPGITLAHNGKNKNDDDRGGKKAEINLNFGLNWRKNRKITGTVAAVSSTGFSLQTTATTTPVNINTANAKIMKAFGLTISLADIKVTDKAEVKGTWDGSAINAKTVFITPANTHRAQGKGTITAVNGSQLTVQQEHRGIVTSFTVNTNASTTVVAQNNSTTTTASLMAGVKIKVKGLWDEIANVLNAVRIKIK